MIEVKQTGPKEFEVFDQAGTLQGAIVEGPGFWIVSLGSHTSKACESYERAVFLAKEYCGCSGTE